MKTQAIIWASSSLFKVKSCLKHDTEGNAQSPSFSFPYHAQKCVFSVVCLYLHINSFSYSGNSENLLEVSDRHALPCLLQFRNPSLTIEDNLQSLQEKSFICTEVTNSSTKIKNCLQNFEHPYILSFTVTSALWFSTLLTNTRFCNCMYFRSEYFSWLHINREGNIFWELVPSWMQGCCRG